jgi:hypothetical protein
LVAEAADQRGLHKIVQEQPADPVEGLEVIVVTQVVPPNNHHLLVAALVMLVVPALHLETVEVVVQEQ